MDPLGVVDRGRGEEEGGAARLGWDSDLKGLHGLILVVAGQAAGRRSQCPGQAAPWPGRESWSIGQEATMMSPPRRP